MPTLQQLRYLVALADQLSFSRAARVCNVTQPTLSVQVRDLETRLGAELVERTRKSVVMTPVGEEIARRARTVLAEIADIGEIAANERRGALAGTLRIGVVQTVGAYVLSLAMPDIRAGFPGLRVRVREERFETLGVELGEGLHDVLLLPDALEADNVTSVCILEEPLHLVVPADHRLAERDAVAPEDLAGETVLSMERGHGLHDSIAALCDGVGAIHAHDYAGTTLDTLRLMVTTGMGISLLPALYVRSDVERERLVVARRLTERAPVRRLNMAWRRSAPRATQYRALAGMIERALAPWGVARR